MGWFCHRHDNDPSDQGLSILEPLVLLRVFSAAEHGMRGVGAACLMLRKCPDKQDCYRRVGLRTVKNKVFEDAKEYDIRIQ